MIRCEQVTWSDAGDRIVLPATSLSCDAGELVAIEGPSGCGKSTLLSIVAAMKRPTSGQVLFNGAPVSRFTASHRDRYRRAIGFLPQHLHLFEDFTADENIWLAAMTRPGSRVDFARRLAELMDRLGLSELRSRATRSLSGGEKQRVALARSLLGQPQLLVLDEPSSHQDDAGVSALVSLIAEARVEGAAVLVASHDPRLEALAPTRRIRPGGG